MSDSLKTIDEVIRNHTQDLLDHNMRAHPDWQYSETCDSNKSLEAKLKAQLEKLIARERLEERKAAMLHTPEYSDDEYNLAIETGLFYPGDIERITQLEQLIAAGEDENEPK